MGRTGRMLLPSALGLRFLPALPSPARQPFISLWCSQDQASHLPPLEPEFGGPPTLILQVKSWPVLALTKAPLLSFGAQSQPCH